MDFLEKLNYLMKRDNLNKSTLSKACDIPYTTIDGWYKKGYEGLKMTTLRKLAKFFGTSLDFWASDQPFDSMDMDDEAKQLAKRYSMLSNKDKELITNMINSLCEKLEVKQPGQTQFGKDKEATIYRAAKSKNYIAPEIVDDKDGLMDKLASLPAVTKAEDL